MPTICVSVSLYEIRRISLLFYLKNGVNVVEIIKENCYAEGAHVTLRNTGSEKWLQAEKSRFSFTVFTTRPRSTSVDVNLICKLKFCLLSDNRCKIHKTTAECPLVPGYNYTPVGYRYK